MNEQHWLFCLCYFLRKPHWLKLLFLKFLSNSDLSLPQDDIELCSFFFKSNTVVFICKQRYTNYCNISMRFNAKVFVISHQFKTLVNDMKKGCHNSVEITNIISTILSYLYAWCRKTGLFVEVKKGVKWNLIFILGVFCLLYNSTVW